MNNTAFRKKIKVNWFLNEISESQTQKKNSKGQVVSFYLIENFINEILNLTCESWIASHKFKP